MNEFSKLVSDFFIRYLTNQKNASENTIKTYRDAVVQLLEFMNSKGIKANKIKITDFSYGIICEYLEWLESNKNVSVLPEIIDWLRLNHYSNMSVTIAQSI